MKKLLGFLVLASFLAFSGIALAENGVVIDAADQAEWVVIDTEGYATGSPRWFNPGEVWGNQSIKVSLPMSALVPCHLEMLFQGNDVNTMIDTFGPNAAAVYTPGNMYIAFHPAVGGYLEGWDYIEGSTSNNALVEPGDTKFIRACDTFRAVLWSNMNYTYAVSVDNGALAGPDNSALPVYMRSSVNVGDVAFNPELNWGGDFNFALDDDHKAEILAGNNKLQTTTVFHQFKVPFDKNHPAGHYTGSISFTAATI